MAINAGNGPCLVAGEHTDGPPPRKSPRQRNIKRKPEIRVFDDNVIATNNSSILSKRSVERLYEPEPHFIKYFCDLPKRRAPTIHRGYWLRMKSIERTALKFLNNHGSKDQTFIVNLGCGYDVLPWSLTTKYPEVTEKTTFIDIDHEDLIIKKTAFIENQWGLVDHLSGPQFSQPELKSNSGHVYVNSSHYVAVGCDLSNTKAVEAALSDVLTKFGTNREQASVLFVAEVSVTYMRKADANRLLSMTAKFARGHFCLLEQILPFGHSHPFAETMLNHFRSLNSTLHSVQHYPSQADQAQRFRTAGWKNVQSRDLWNVWQDEEMISKEERINLEDVEPFDEWEELALFGMHYILLVASNEVCSMAAPHVDTNKIPLEKAKSLPGHWVNASSTARRSGILFEAEPGIFVHTSERKNSSNTVADVYSTGLGLPTFSTENDMRLELEGSEQQVTKLPRQNRHLVTGGRLSPRKALAETYLYDLFGRGQDASLPSPSYRHCAAAVRPPDASEGVLIFGGKSSAGKALDQWCLWTEAISESRGSSRWQALQCCGDQIKARFGAGIHRNPLMPHTGILFGGMDDAGLVFQDYYFWSLLQDREGKLIVDVKKGVSDKFSSLSRYGATVTSLPDGFAVVGGLTHTCLPLPGRPDLLVLKPNYNTNDDSGWYLERFELSTADGNFPFLLHNHSTVFDGRQIVITGGGATCFSFGAFRNPGVLYISLDGDISKIKPWIRVNLDQKADSVWKHGMEKSHDSRPIFSQPITIYDGTVLSRENFANIVRNARPVILRSLDLGQCSGWSIAGLKTKMDVEKTTTVHEAESSSMSFTNKNFVYKTVTVRELLADVQEGKHTYLRALTNGNKRKTPADFWMDWPELAEDVKLPDQVRAFIFGAENNEAQRHSSESRYHSAVLRVSGPVNMWLHYDVMANTLTQIDGFKKMVLFPPSDIPLLGIRAGDSSSPLNFLSPSLEEEELLSKLHPQSAILRPGDILFIPPFWCHTAAPLSLTSIAVNVFFRDHDFQAYAAGRDLYGNRDLSGYEEGRKAVQKIQQGLKDVSNAGKGFYLRRLAMELEQLALDAEQSDEQT